jgi:hypothetical protein
LALWPWNGGGITVSPLTSPSHAHAAAATVVDEGTAAANTNQGGVVALRPPRIKWSLPPPSIRACCSPPLRIRRRHRRRALGAPPPMSHRSGRRRRLAHQAASLPRQKSPHAPSSWALAGGARQSRTQSLARACAGETPRAGTFPCPAPHPYSDAGQRSCRHHSGRSLSLSAAESEKQRTESKRMC